MEIKDSKLSSRNWSQNREVKIKKSKLKSKSITQNWEAETEESKGRSLHLILSLLKLSVEKLRANKMRTYQLIRSSSHFFGSMKPEMTDIPLFWKPKAYYQTFWKHIETFFSFHIFLFSTFKGIFIWCEKHFRTSFSFLLPLNARIIFNSCLFMVYVKTLESRQSIILLTCKHQRKRFCNGTLVSIEVTELTNMG